MKTRTKTIKIDSANLTIKNSREVTLTLSSGDKANRELSERANSSEQPALFNIRTRDSRLVIRDLVVMAFPETSFGKETHNRVWVLSIIHDTDKFM